MRSISKLWHCGWVVAGVLASGIAPAAEEAKPADKEDAKGEKVTYTDHILPIFREKCGSCHNANDQKGGLTLDNYGAVMQGGGSGEVVTPTDAEGSYLWMVVSHESEPFMPPNQPRLDDATLELIRKWIDGGALQNADSVVKPKKPDVAAARVEISNERPSGPSPLPESIPTEPVHVGSRGNVVTALAVSPWAPLAAVAGHQQVLLYHTELKTLMGVLPFPEGTPQVLKFSRNSQLLLAGGGRGGQSGRVVVWDVKTGKRVFEVGDEYDAVLAADISPDQTQIALGGPKRMLRVYEAATGELLYEQKKHTDWVTAIEFSPDGVLLASADRSNGVVVWEAFTGREFHVLTGHTDAVTDVSWRNDSNVLVSGSEDGTVRLWEMQNGREIKRWNAHAGGVTSLEFLRDGRVATTGRDRGAKLWDQAGKELAKFQGLSDIGLEAAFDAETDQFLAGDWTGNVSVWNAKETKDASPAWTLSTNPPTLAAQLETVQQALAAAEQEAAQAQAETERLAREASERAAAVETIARQAAEAAVRAQAAAEGSAVVESLLESQQSTLKQAEAALAAAMAARDAALKALKQTEATVAEAKARTVQARLAAEEQKAAAAKASAAAEPTDEARQASEKAAAAAQQAAARAELLQRQLDRLRAQSGTRTASARD